MFENRGLEILIIALVVLLLFGSRRLPDVARSLGKSLRIIKAETTALRTDSGAASESAAGPEPVVPVLVEAEPVDAVASSRDAVTHSATPR